MVYIAKNLPKQPPILNALLIKMRLRHIKISLIQKQSINIGILQTYLSTFSLFFYPCRKILRLGTPSASCKNLSSVCFQSLLCLCQFCLLGLNFITQPFVQCTRQGAMEACLLGSTIELAVFFLFIRNAPKYQFWCRVQSGSHWYGTTPCFLPPSFV